MSPRIEKLRDAVQVMHRCKATHVESVPVIETFQERTIWDGVVEVFAISGHPEASKCYAWLQSSKEGDKFSVVLGVGPIKYPQDAVRAYIMSSTKT